MDKHCREIRYCKNQELFEKKCNDLKISLYKTVSISKLVQAFIFILDIDVPFSIVYTFDENH